MLAAIQRCADYPKAWVLFSGDIRRSLVRRFPYGILYAEAPQGIYILAVMNLHREPDYWKKKTGFRPQAGSEAQLDPCRQPRRADAPLKPW